MRAAYLSSDRPDVAEAPKTYRYMKSPNTAKQPDMKRLGRYIVSHRCLVSRFKYTVCPPK
eukprot:5131497-Pyramimonas_sp.AAC.1